MDEERRDHVVRLIEERIASLEEAGEDFGSREIAEVLEPADYRSISVQAQSDGRRFAWIEFQDGENDRVWIDPPQEESEEGGEEA